MYKMHYHKLQHSITFTHSGLTKLLIFIQSGLRIIFSKQREKKLAGNETEIITKIHSLRYADETSYVTTGGHFSQLYVRNLGIFLNALLDPRIPSDNKDWQDRQCIALKTIALDLEVFTKAKRAYTTIVPLYKHIYSAMNIYTEPSDSLFGILYTLCALTDDYFISSLFPTSRIKTIIRHQLQTKQAAKELIATYKHSLISLITDYQHSVLDPETGLVKTTISLASARDGIKRQSSFYDNVICWATAKLANKLALISISEKTLLDWKKKIITTFWDSDEGIFLDDLSDEAKQQKLFSADSFIVTSTGFFDTSNASEVKKLKHMIHYVQKNALDKPFPLRYSKANNTKKLYWPVRIGAPAYMSTTIWSHWGIEYIKALLLLGEKTVAKEHLAMYKRNIEHFGGYPELYDEKGNMYTTRLYRSVLHNSWVINYEQANMLLAHI